MNHPSEKSFADQLRQLSPAASTSDVRSVFYEAGYEAGKSQFPKTDAWPVRLLVVAACVAGMIALPIGYQVGFHAAASPEMVAQSLPDTSDFGSEPATPPTQVDVSLENESNAEQDWFTKWLNPMDGLSEETIRHWESAPHLQALHASIVARNVTDSSLADIPFSRMTPPSGLQSAVVLEPMAVSDLRDFSYNLEAIR
ncbi:MAG: hypothetical protein AB8B91_08425 [Rubripirellula sp.]